MNTSHKPNPYSAFPEKTRQSKAAAAKAGGREAHHPLDDEQKLLEIFAHLSEPEDDLAVKDLYPPEAPTPMMEEPLPDLWFEPSEEAVAPAVAANPGGAEPECDQSVVSEREMMDILHHLSQQADSSEATEPENHPSSPARTEAPEQTEWFGPFEQDVQSTSSASEFDQLSAEDLVVSEQDVMGALHHLARQDEDLGDVEQPYCLEDALEQEDLGKNHRSEEESLASETKASSSSSRGSRNLLTRLGLTSLAVTGSGVGVWLTASVLSPSADDPQQEDLAVEHSERDPIQTSRITATVAPPALDSLSPEFNSSAIKPPTVKPKTSASSASPLESAAQPASSSAIDANSPAANSEATAAPHSALSSLIHKRLLTHDDLKDLSDWDLTLLRNEIYARHGRHFLEQELKQYFEAQNWYQPRHAPGSFPISNLSGTEIQNAIFIRDYQHMHEKFYQWE